MKRLFRSDNSARLALLRRPESAPLNGIEAIEVLTTNQLTLRVTFVRNIAATLTAAHCAISGGVRITGIRILPESFQRSGRNLTFKVDRAGDFSWYEFALQDPAAPQDVPEFFDPVLSSLRFSFKAQCPSDFDCADDGICPPTAPLEPALDYLAKDYASFRRLMLDRMASRVPGFDARHPADFNMALVELFAHVGDQLSYQQDAVATESYLGTARRRVSLRRHARLLDYPVHEGSNSRTWVCFDVQAGADGRKLAASTRLLSRDAGVATGADAGAGAGMRFLSTADFERLPEVSAGSVAVFETLHELVLNAAHGRIAIHRFSDPAFCLPRGCTSAALVLVPGMALQAGMVLLLEEVLSPTTGVAADADPQRRHAVRLVDVQPGRDELTKTDLLLVRWHEADALPFALCVGAEFPDGGATTVRETAVARGNAVLADHGHTQPWQALIPPTAPEVGPWRPRLPDTGLAHAQPYIHSRALLAPAAAARVQDLQHIRPAGMQLVADDALVFGDQPDPSAEAWTPQPDLLGSDRFMPDFVAETDSDGSVHLRFGDNHFGAAPDAGSRLIGRWRLGGGAAGNVGADSLTRVVCDDALITNHLRAVRNPLAASGGTDPDSAASIRARAPEAFRTQERAVTDDDYARAAERHPEVQRAVARLRWTGSWYTVFISVDRRGGKPVDAAFRAELMALLERYRLTGQDLDIRPPQMVALDVALAICVLPGYFAADVQRRLLQRLGTGADGYFNPDLFTFGQGLALSSLVAAAQAVTGVASVGVLRLQRWGRAAHGELGQGWLGAAPLEVLRLDNDPNFPENGRLRLQMKGGL